MSFKNINDAEGGEATDGYSQEAALDKQNKKMLETPIPKLVLSLAVPTVITMLVTAIYNMADTFFVSKINDSAAGAISVIFPLMAAIQSVGFMTGMGSGSLISRLHGVREHKKADAVCSSGLILSLAFGVVIGFLGIIFVNPFVRFLGATETILPYARTYAIYILATTPIMCASFLMNNVLRAEGKAKFSMIGLVTGSILNIGLDALFVLKLNMGIRGAALSTAICQTISFLILLMFFVLGKSQTKLKFFGFSREARVYFSILKTGFPSFCRQALAAVSTVLLNNFVNVYSDSAIAAMGYVSKVFMMVFCVALGIGQGYQPVLGYNYSTGNYDRVRSAFKFTWLVSTLLMSFCALLCFVFSEQIMRAINSQSAEAIAIGSKGLRYTSLAMPFMPLNFMSGLTFQAIGKKWQAIALSCTRQGAFYVPIIIIFANTAGLLGIQLSQAVSDFCGFLFCVPFAVYFFKLLKIKEKENLAKQYDSADAILQ